MASGDVSGWRSDVPSIAHFACCLCRGHSAGARMVGIRHATTARPSRAQRFAISLADFHGDCVQADAACGRHCDQFLGAAVFSIALGAVAQGARRPGAVDRPADRFSRRAHRSPSGSRFAHPGRAVRARERGHVRERDGCGARHNRNRIDRHAGDVADGCSGGTARVPAAARLPAPGSRRCGDDGPGRHRQCAGAVSLDAGAAAGPRRGGVSVLLSAAGVGAPHRVRGLG